MSVLAANGILIQASSDDMSYNEVDGLNDASYAPNADLLDTTDFKDGTTRTRIVGLRDFSVSLSGDYEHSDTAQALLRSSEASGATVYLRLLWDGTNGVKVTCKVESFTVKGSVAGKVEFSCSLKATAAAAAYP